MWPRNEVSQALATLSGVNPVVVCGPVNLETSVPADRFPVEAAARRMVDGIEAHVSGIACNVAAGLAALDTPVRLTAITGADEVGQLVRRHLAGIRMLDVSYVDVPESPQTVVLLAPDGTRAVFSDLKDTRSVALGAAPDLEACSAFVPVAIPANVSAVRRAVQADLPVLVDVQTIETVTDPDREPFCEAATVLAMSGARIASDPADWLRRMGDRYGTPFMVLGLSDRGAMLARDAGTRIDHVPALTGPVRSTVGAGDALWACFIDGYLKGADPLWSLRRAVAAAGHKVASLGGTAGFATMAVLEEMGWGPPGVALRPVTDADIDIFFEHQRDPVANAMAAFPARTREAHVAHWRKVLANESAVNRTITVDGEVVGNIASWRQEDEQEVGYWIGRDHWGKGIATQALSRLLEIERKRPIHAHVVAHNLGSIRVLEKCGFAEVERAEVDGVEELSMVLED
jgi:sugar/nucleoside kinase (ribokinase family)/RimJ/RimL family protein N-acetyltransferase